MITNDDADTIRGLPLSDKINYRKNVNQQLAGAAFQLSLLKNSTLSLSKLQKTSCHQATLYHLFTGLQFYLNEILSNYKRETIDFQNKKLTDVFIGGLLKQYSIVELNELQQWYEKENSLIYYLLQFEQGLVQHNDNKQERKNEGENIIIAVIAEEKTDLLSNNQELLQLQIELSALIDRQRESLLEH